MFGLMSKKKHEKIVAELVEKVGSYAAKFEKIQTERQAHERDRKRFMEELELRPNPRFKIDFERMSPFSIERTKDSRTVLGYYFCPKDGEWEIKEWTLDCNTVEHEKLVQEFTEWVVTKVD